MITVIPEPPREQQSNQSNQSDQSNICHLADGCSVDFTDVRHLSFDIETGPLPDEQLQQHAPEFVAPPHPGEFDEASVKTGNMKDAKKIAEKIEAARQAHKQSVRDFALEVEAKRVQFYTNFISTAALNAATGRVLTVGLLARRDEVQVAGREGRAVRCESQSYLYSSPGQPSDAEAHELSVLKSFWDTVEESIGRGVPLVGHNIHGFDLPFLVRRSWILGVPIPVGVLTGSGRKYWNSLFIDLMREWSFHANHNYLSLNDIAKAFGLRGKAIDAGDLESGEVGICGETFHVFWLSDDETRQQKAIGYVLRDVELPAEIAERMGVV